MENSKAVSTLMVTDRSPRETGRDNVKFPYRKVVGALGLMNLMIATRPDISYVVGVVSRSLENPTAEDVSQVKIILRYQNDTENLGIVYCPDRNSSALEEFSDAHQGGDVDTRRSTTGSVCKYAGGTISWLSQ
ncbi:hypothetical protein PR048_010633 [Dryococelus australis]|uniref:Uncharacterized protein n=1 Tax=Dryococelus australis TaxID=614101 RepID=A0ABQ9I393_9NEOP|nr:hypothetical protein PR048_010633 [Dryococelus australis]